MRRSVPALLAAGLLLSACHRSPVKEDPDYGDEVTDTVPAFYGRVPKNVLMISMDTFRVDHLDRAPFLSTVAAQGFRAVDTTQCSNWTFASTSCTLAGRYNEQAGMIPQLAVNFDGIWPVGTPFLASYLHDAGYYSVIASTNGWLGPEWGNTGGYDDAFHPQNGTAWGAYLEARERLDAHLEQGADRWLMHVHVTEPHASYSPPLEYLGGLDALDPVPWDLDDRDEQYDVTRNVWPSMTDEERDLLKQHLLVRYDGELKYLDDQVFRMIAGMDFDGLLDDTLVVFWTDHGEAFWDHDQQTHAYTLFREENDGLLFFWAKNIVPQVWTGPVSSIDMVPTVLKLLGQPLPDTVTGIPIGEAPDDRPRFANTIARFGPISSVIQDHWKMIFRWDGTVQLYDLAADPQEQTDLYDPAAPTDRAKTLWAELRPRIEEELSVVPGLSAAWPSELE
ncbi:MAG: sulfatase-like hydrolase/transferase [Myxococcota bacterium]